MKNRLLSFFLVLLLVFISSNTVFAQSDELIQKLESISSQEDFNNFIDELTPEDEQEFFGSFVDTQGLGGDIPGAVNCFDHYEFGSVTAKPFSEIRTASSGQMLGFGLEIVNNNPYPVVDLEVYVRVFRSQEDSANTKNNADHIVDQFRVVEDLSLLANESKRTEFFWNIPQDVLSGNYRLVTFVVSSGRYNLNGLSFTDDITGNSTNFSIVGKDEGVYFDKNTVTVDGEQHTFVSALNVLDKDVPIEIEVDVVNDTDEDQAVYLEWSDYVWDSANEDNLINTDEDKVFVPAKSSVSVSHVLKDNTKPVYLVIPKLSYKDTKSFLNIRFARDANDYPRINFPGVDSYPVSDETTFFVCLHSVGQKEIIEGVTYRAEFVNEKGKVFHSYEYNGKVSSGMMGLVETFSPFGEYSSFKINSTLLHNGKVIDTDSLEYNCKDLSPDLCQDRSNFIPWISVAIGILLILGIIGIVIHKKSPEEIGNI